MLGSIAGSGGWWGGGCCPWGAWRASSGSCLPRLGWDEGGRGSCCARPVLGCEARSESWFAEEGCLTEPGWDEGWRGGCCCPALSWEEG